MFYLTISLSYLHCHDSPMSTYVYVFVRTCVFIPLGSIWGGNNLGSRIAGPCGNSMFKLLQNYQTIFHHACTILHSRQQCMRVPISDVLVSACYNCLFNYAILSSVRRRQWHPTPVLLPGKSHGRRSLEACSPWGRWGLDTTERLHFHFSLPCIGEGNGNPLQCSCLENPRDGGAWWAAIYGVSQSRTRLKWLSSSSSSSTC